MFAYIGALVILLVTAIAQNASSGSTFLHAQKTATLFLPPEARDDSYLGSVVNADACGTTIALACTLGRVRGKINLCPTSATVYPIPTTLIA